MHQEASCKQSCDDDPQCIAVSIFNQQCTLFEATCFEKDRPIEAGKMLHIDYTRTAQWLALEQEQTGPNAFNSTITLTSQVVTPGTLFSSMVGAVHTVH